MHTFLVVLLAAAASTPAPRSVTVTDLFLSFNVFDGAGEVAVAVDHKRTVTDAPGNSSVETKFKTPKSVFVYKQQMEANPPAGKSKISATLTCPGDNAKIEYESGPEEQHVPALGENTTMVFGHQVIKCGAARLNLSEITDADLLAGKISTKELAAFREAVPDSLKDFCEVLLEANDLLDSGPILIAIARLGAPKDARMGIAASHGWYKGEEIRKKVKKELPILSEPPAEIPPGAKVTRIKISGQ